MQRVQESEVSAMNRCKHDWSRWRAGQIFWSLFLNERTRLMRQCRECGDVQIKSIKGRWKNSEDA